MKEHLLIGTYSRNGIYEFCFSNKNLIESKINHTYENCSYICKNNDIIYSITEYSDNPNFSNGYLVSRNLDLSIQSEASILGSSPCHITIDYSRNLLYISNYEDGSLNIFSLNKDGSIKALIYHKKYTEHSHIHCTALSSDDKFLFVIDLGDNKLFAYKIIFSHDSFELIEIYNYDFGFKTHPRHLVVNEEKLFIITENSCELYHLSFTEQDGFRLINKVSILPSATPKEENFTGCAIKLSADKKFIYTTIRDHNSISVFNSSLELIQNISCNGNTPRYINFNNSQEFLFCTNQGSSDISIFSVNKTTGHLLFESKYPVANPACIITL